MYDYDWCVWLIISQINQLKQTAENNVIKMSRLTLSRHEYQKGIYYWRDRTV